MIEAYIRPALQQILVDPLANRLSLVSICTPNKITLFALLTGILASILIVLDFPVTSILLLLISGYLDVLDGTVARIRQKSSALGTVYDIVSDRAVEISILIALYAVNPELRGTACLLMLGSILLCVTSFLVIGIVKENKSTKGFHYSSGIIERAEAFIFFIFMIAFPAIFLLLAYIFTVLVLFTTFIRIYQFKYSQ